MVDRLLCEHPVASSTRVGYRQVCGVCGSYWDLDSVGSDVAYDASYPEKRGHWDPGVGALKVRSLEHWIARSGADIAGRHVCEVGFGGGSCLPFLASRARRVTGLEANAEAVRRVGAMGIEAELLLVQSLPARLVEPVDLWLFQDSFEHIPDPAAFLEWMLTNTAPGGEILMVLPRADSLSRRLMGRYWPHRLPDHEFQWSRRGLIEFMQRRGFEPEREFFPIKFASPQMILAHFLHKAGATDSVGVWTGSRLLAIPINFGELGVRFRYRGGKIR